MTSKPFIVTLLVLGGLTNQGGAALLSIQFAGGGSEVTLAAGGTVQMDVVWTMQPTDTAKSRISAIDMRFNASSGPDPDGPENLSKFTVQSVTTAIPGWEIFAHTGIGQLFNDGAFFLGAGHTLGDLGVIGNGTEFSTTILSIVLRKNDFQPGDTFISFRHDGHGDPLPAPYNFQSDWAHMFQGTIIGPNQFRMGLGNPGDAGAQFDPYHGYETFQPLIIHNLPEPSAMALMVLAMLGMRRMRS